MKTETIKCRDLMVGDWIADNNGFKLQTIVVGDDYAYATFDGNEADPWEFDDKDDQPQPIEITRELLEANGWKEPSFMRSEWDSIVWKYYFVKNEGNTHLEYKSGTLTIWFNYTKNSGEDSDILVPCKYVHQLQGALRLAGLTDMANNFKV